MYRWIEDLLNSPSGHYRRPILRDHFESSIPGVFVIGDLAGASVLKIAIQQGHEVAHHLAARPRSSSAEFDVIVAGAGGAGLNCALEARELGLRVLLLEKNRIANTIEEFPEGKWLYAEPPDLAVDGKLWIGEAEKRELLVRWNNQVAASGLAIRTAEGITGLRRRKDGTIEVHTSKCTYASRFLVIATGQRGNPRKLGVPGEEREHVQHRLYSPQDYENEDIVVVGGGNAAVEAAVALAGRNRVTLSYRASEFRRVFKDNERKLAESGVRVIFNSNVVRFGESACTLDSGEELPSDHAFVLIGADPPVGFLKSLGLRLENEWTPARFAALLLSFMVAYAIFSVKQAPGHEYWPFRGWGARALTFFDRPWSFWYTVLYTLVVTVFGLQAMKRWGFDRKDRFQIWRYASLIGFQWTFFFVIPEFLFRYLVGPDQAWRSYGLVYAWPLFFNAFFYANRFWIIYGVFLTFLLIPVLVLFHGKRYCSWICGCGGLAETLGDRWRHLAPKGRRSIQWERMNGVVLALAVAVTALMLLQDGVSLFRKPALAAADWYHVICDTWLVGIIPIAVYPFFGGKIWCRYWCPLAKMMEMFSWAFTRFRASRFAIHANEKCIACGECSRNCQVGIDVMAYALKQDVINNYNSSCIGCGICITACPMNVLSFREQARVATPLVQIASNTAGARTR